MSGGDASNMNLNQRRNKRKKSSLVHPPPPPSSSSSSSSSSLKWGAKIHTLDTIDAYMSSKYDSSSSSSSSSTSTFKIQHIPNLPSSDYAQSILKRIQNEFQLLVQKRGYTITSVTEMCCCDDGLNYLSKNSSADSNSNSTNNKDYKKRGRKVRTMPNNVLGYNLTHGHRGSRGNTIHRIHLRLRHPKNHGSFYSYEDIAGTMCHELAHCEVGAHNAKFYKLMDEIMEQYEVFLVRGLILDKSGFPMGSSSETYTLGGSGGGGRGKGRGAAGLAAKKRLEQREKLGIGGSYVLGGGMSYVQDIQRKENEQRKNGFNIYGKSNGINKNTNATLSSSSSSSSTSLANLPPREAARIAAERRVEERRRIDSMHCLPCQEIIEILDGDSSDEEDTNDGIGDQKKVSASASTLKPVQVKIKNGIIDLVDSYDNEDGKSFSSSCRQWNCSICTFVNESMTTSSCQICGAVKHKFHPNSNGDAVVVPPKLKLDIGIVNETNDEKESSNWGCSECTFAENAQLSLSCQVCGAERRSAEGTEKLIEKIVRQDFIQDVKSKEKERSLQDFGGFNIYGGDKQSSSQMKHLT